MSVQPIEGVNEFERFVSGAPSLVLFSAPWCSPGERLARRLERLVPPLPVAVGLVDCDRFPALPRRYGVAGLPTLILFQGRMVVALRSGELSPEAIADWIEATIELAAPSAPPTLIDAAPPAARTAGHP